MARDFSVAVLDRDPGARAGLADHLGAAPGITVVGVAGNAEEGTRLVREHRPDVVLMDVRGLAASGPDLIRRLMSAEVPPEIVILTGHVTGEERAELLRAGVRLVLFKQIDSTALIQALQPIGAMTA